VIDDDLPSIHSHSEDEDWSSGVSDEDSPLIDENDDNSSKTGTNFADSDAEMPYESLPRKQRQFWESEADPGIARLPIKLANGRLESRGATVVLSRPPPESSSSQDSDSDASVSEAIPREDVATGARFGRPAVVDVVATKSRKARIQAAKDQIASICQEIVADPENSVCVSDMKVNLCLNMASARASQTASHVFT
jgi:nucleolar complex protein 3